MEDFLDGKLIIVVSNLKESRFLINLAVGNGFPKDKDLSTFEDTTYEEYPFYFIEDKVQLQANKTSRNAMIYEHCLAVKEFKEVFSNQL